MAHPAFALDGFRTAPKIAARLGWDNEHILIAEYVKIGYCSQQDQSSNISSLALRRLPADRLRADRRWD